MTVLPSPIPHPLDYFPGTCPAGRTRRLEWVIGFEWPEGDEKAIWDVADAWFATASALVAPRDDAYRRRRPRCSPGTAAPGMVGRAFDEAPGGGWPTATRRR